jgi:hypothetical protein
MAPPHIRKNPSTINKNIRSMTISNAHQSTKALFGDLRGGVDAEVVKSAPWRIKKSSRWTHPSTKIGGGGGGLPRCAEIGRRA